MVCSRCNIDKVSHLFAPGQVARGHKGLSCACTKCISQAKGHEFGAVKKGLRKSTSRVLWGVRQERRFNHVRKQLETQETQRLIGARRARLQGAA